LYHSVQQQSKLRENGTEKNLTYWSEWQLESVDAFQIILCFSPLHQLVSFGTTTIKTEHKWQRTKMLTYWSEWQLIAVNVFQIILCFRPLPQLVFFGTTTIKPEHKWERKKS
jgi:hypothetical protein